MNNNLDNQNNMNERNKFNCPPKIIVVAGPTGPTERLFKSSIV